MKDDMEVNITQPAVYFVESGGHHSRRRPGARRHALRPLHEVGVADEDVEPTMMAAYC